MNPQALQPLQALLPPLRYACRDGFAQLPTLKGFEATVTAALQKAVAAGFPREPATVLFKHLRGFEKMAAPARVEAMRAFVKDLGAHVELPSELGSATPPARVPRAPSPSGEGKPPARPAAAPAFAPPVGAPPRPANGLTPARAPVARVGPSVLAPGVGARVVASVGSPSPSIPSELSGASRSEPGGVAERAPKQNVLPLPPQAKLKRTAAAGPAARKSAEEDDEDVPYAIAPPKVPTLSVVSGPLSTPLKDVQKVHSRLQSLLTKKHLEKAGDALYLLPRAYEDRRKISTLASLRPGERGSAIVEVKRLEESFGKGGRGRNLKVIFGDHTGTVAGTFFNAGPWMKQQFPVGKRLLVSGELRATAYGRDMAHPEVEPADDWPAPGMARAPGQLESLHFERIVPVYPGFERGMQRTYRELVDAVVERFTPTLFDPLPESLRTRMNLPSLAEALRELHFPSGKGDFEKLMRWSSPYHQRLAFDELFFLQLGLSIRRQGVKVEQGIAFKADAATRQRALDHLPWPLTGAQGRVLDEITADMVRPEPMNRLLQGDVGSGKTAVALCACLIAIENGYQAAVMAPTEILAEQHFRTLSNLAAKSGVKVGLFTGSAGAKARREMRAALAKGEIQLAVGTHALLEEGVAFEKLGLVVIDEQHRFGVMQRATLRSKGVMPDVLVMTATPIPRTLAMSAYGDLDLSVIDQMPPGRTPIVTTVFHEQRRPQAYERMKADLAAGRQAYVVYPLVEESEKLDLESATEGFERLKAEFKGYQVGLLHGRMKAEEKETVMALFRANELQILVATTVVEVGVDVPNATCMLIESSERFGLSQLHQLRGRVGRGAHASQCLLVANTVKSQVARERLETMEQSTDGFVIAQKDLDLRGPGEFLGTRQSGLPELSVANLARDQQLLVAARKEAQLIIDRDPRMKLPEHAPLLQALRDRWEGKLDLSKVG